MDAIDIIFLGIFAIFMFAIGGASGMATLKEQLRRSGYIVIKRSDGSYYISDIRAELAELDKE